MVEEEVKSVADVAIGDGSLDDLRQALPESGCAL